jgi:hypothetical protein
MVKTELLREDQAQPSRRGRIYRNKNIESAIERHEQARPKRDDLGETTDRFQPV